MSDLILPALDRHALAQSVHRALQFPLPGSEPEDIRAAARLLRHNAKTLRQALDRALTMSGNHQFWVGGAASAFAEKASHAPKHINAVADRYESYAAVLERYATAVSTSRSAVRMHREALRQAWQTYLAAQTSAAVAPAALPGAQAAAPSTAAERVVACRAPVTAAPHTDAVRAAYAQLRRCYTDWDDSARTAARQLHRADDGNALRNPHGLHAFVDAVDDAASYVSKRASIAALVLMVVCPELAPVAFAVIAVASATKTVADADRRFAYGEKVTSWDFATDAVGLVPASGFVRAGKEAATAVRGGEGALKGGRKLVGVVAEELTAPISDGVLAGRSGVTAAGRGAQWVTAGGVRRTAVNAVAHAVVTPLTAGTEVVGIAGRTVGKVSTNMRSAVMQETESFFSTVAGAADFGPKQAVTAVDRWLHPPLLGRLLYDRDRAPKSAAGAPVRVTLPTTDGVRRTLTITIPAPAAR